MRHERADAPETGYCPAAASGLTQSHLNLSVRIKICGTYDPEMDACLTLL